jgi:hypothetical protein
MNIQNTQDLLAHLQLVANASNRKDEPEDETPQDVDLRALKSRALKEVRQQRHIEKFTRDARRGKGVEAGHTSHNMIICTEQFMSFVRSDLCDDLVISAIYYVSSTFWLKDQGPPLDSAGYAEQEHHQTDALRILSSIYCQLLMSPMSAHLRVREERVFYETLIFFLDACVCFALRTENPDAICSLLGQVFRRDLQDPRVRRRGEFLPITEIVRRHWLSQRVPGKTRAEIAHTTLQGTTKLIEPLCQKELPSTARDQPTSTDVWLKSGYPKNTRIPIGQKIIPRADILDLSPPKQADPLVPMKEPTVVGDQAAPTETTV